MKALLTHVDDHPSWQRLAATFAFVSIAASEFLSLIPVWANETQRYAQLKATIAKDTQILRREPKNANALVERGCCEEQLEQFEAALSDLDSGLTLDPKLGTAYVLDCRRRANTYFEHWQLALRDADAAVAVDPTGGWRLRERGELHCMLKQKEPALKDFDRAIELNSKDYWSWMDRAKLRASMNMIDKALDDCNAAIKLKPTTGDGYAYRAGLYDKLSKPDLAKKDREVLKRLGNF